MPAAPSEQGKDAVASGDPIDPGVPRASGSSGITGDSRVSGTLGIPSGIPDPPGLSGVSGTAIDSLPASTVSSSPSGGTDAVAHSKAKLSGSISIKMEPPKPLERPAFLNNSQELTKEAFDSHWANMLQMFSTSNLEIYNLLNGKEVDFPEKSVFVIKTYDGYFENEFKKVQMQVLEDLRARTSMPLLNCRVELLVKEVDSLPVSPLEKFEAMKELNPALELLHKYFPKIDF